MPLFVIDFLIVSGCVDGISDACDSTRSGNDFLIDELGTSSATKSRPRYRYCSACPTYTTRPLPFAFSKMAGNMRIAILNDV